MATNAIQITMDQARMPMSKSKGCLLLITILLLLPNVYTGYIGRGAEWDVPMKLTHQKPKSNSIARNQHLILSVLDRTR